MSPRDDPQKEAGRTPRSPNHYEEHVATSVIAQGAFAVALEMVCFVPSRSAAPQKRRHPLPGVLHAAVCRTRDSPPGGAAKRGAVHVSSGRPARRGARGVRMKGGEKAFPCLQTPSGHPCGTRREAFQETAPRLGGCPQVKPRAATLRNTCVTTFWGILRPQLGGKR